MNINIEELYKRSDYINKQTHPTINFYSIWNYNTNCEIESAWDKYTKMSRGLIIDSSGNVIARPPKKFFNLNQQDETKLENLPKEMPIVTEKIDGSLGILYTDIYNKNNNNVYIATRGSFVSEQAVWATKWIQDKGYKKTDFKDGYTYVFEIVYPKNRIVIDYGDRAELVLLAVRHIDSGDYIDYIEEAHRLNFNCAKVYKFDSMEQILDWVDAMEHNEEGFVLRYSNGLFVKVKGKEYVRLHRVISNLSNKSVWEILKNGESTNNLKGTIPNEFYLLIKKYEEELNKQFNDILKEVESIHKEVVKLNGRKEQAVFIMNKHKKFAGLIFPMLDNKIDIVKKQIWVMLQPDFEKLHP